MPKIYNHSSLNRFSLSRLHRIKLSAYSLLTPILRVILLAALALSQSAIAASNKAKVGITRSIDNVSTNHNGIPVTIKRVQDPNNRLADDFTKTSRPCPPFCIEPMEVIDGVKTIGELEVLAFISDDVVKGSGLLIDARLPRFYNSETIPSSVNVPFVLFTNDILSILPFLGVQKINGRWNFSTALDLVLFCNGPWCGQSPRAILGLVKAGYPRHKLFHYRGGLQMWKNLSLTTVQFTTNEVGN